MSIRLPAGAAPLGAALLLATACASAASPSPASAQAAPDYLYVCNQDGASISIIDIGSLAVTRTIRLQDLGFSDNAKPHHAVVEPDGSFWYVTLIGENRVLKFNRANELVGQAQMETPGLLGLQPGGELLFVGRSMSAVNPPRRLGIIRRGDMKIDEVDIFFPRPHALDVHPSGRYVYSASLAVNQLASLDVETEQVGLVELEGPNHVLAHGAMAPDGSTLVIATHMPHVMIFDLADPAKPRLDGSIDVGEMPWHPIFAADGRTLYVPNQGSDNISVIDMRTRTVTKTITGPGLAQPYGSALSPDGRYAFFSNLNTKAAHDPEHTGPAAANGTVVVVDTGTNEIVKAIEVGRGPTGMGTRHAR